VWNTIVFKESKICKEYQVNVKTYLNMIKKKLKDSIWIYLSNYWIQLCFWFIPWLRVILDDVCMVNKKRWVIVGHINEWISVFFWYQLLNIPAWYWYCWVPWLVWSMCIHDIEIGMRQVYIHEWYYLRSFLSLFLVQGRYCLRSYESGQGPW
jgi:hypothetical protein